MEWAPFGREGTALRGEQNPGLSAQAEAWRAQSVADPFLLSTRETPSHTPPNPLPRFAREGAFTCAIAWAKGLELVDWGKN